ncbi:ribosomal protein S2, flavodoxin-like domain-containing protein [Hygrophoropsis aurantiaca]|uniref:Ribosomal protein S2, flavodoxin-like domain-containing protein n=1 Tax=Hygrophoropsis aurantiaca TaxID=72124 RepID=A0ACB8AFY4_9AGAM|nr:ribosomal protein S2, flavodoxin-like domain-containing protein [Hygrophoropsis aurantiaca]
MASPSLRSCLAASKCISKNTSSASRIFARTAFTAQQSPARPLENEEDWQSFREDRAYFKSIVDLYSEFGSTQTRENTFQPHHSLHRPPAPSQLTLSALIAAGAHFGHAKSLLNPNFMPYAYGVRAGITIIDLDQTLPLLRRAANLTRSIVARDGTIVFVGTRPELRAFEPRAPPRHNQPDHPPNSLMNMRAIRECAIQHIPTIGIVDSNVDPRIVMYPIPANDESPRTAELIAGVLSIAGQQGKVIRDEKEARRQQMQARYDRGRERVAETLLAMD